MAPKKGKPTTKKTSTSKRKGKDRPSRSREHVQSSGTESDDESEPTQKRSRRPSRSTSSSSKNPPEPMKWRISIAHGDFNACEDTAVTLRLCILSGKKKPVFSDDWFTEKVEGIEANSEWKEVEAAIDRALETHEGSIKYERVPDSAGNSLYTHHPDFSQDSLTEEPDIDEEETLKSMNNSKAYQKALNNVAYQLRHSPANSSLRPDP